MYTVDGGEPVSFSRISSPAVAEVPQVDQGGQTEVATSASRSPVSSVPTAPAALSSGGATVGRTGATGATPPNVYGGGGGVTTAGANLPIPSAAEQKASMALLKEVYQPRWDAAEQDGQKKALAKEMLAQANQIDPSSADRYVLLQVVQRIATETGDTAVADDALVEMERSYQIDGFSVRTALLQAIADNTHQATDHQYVYRQAKDLVQQALAADQFALARDLIEVAETAGRKDNNRYVVRELAVLRRDIGAQEAKYKEVKHALNNLDNDLLREKANLVVGQYHCLFKGQWEKGLEMLARGGDTQLSQIAQADLNGPATAEDQVRLGDRWWQLAQGLERTMQRHVRLRAAHWYRMALPQLSPGLLRSKVEIRVKEIDSEQPAQATERKDLGPGWTLEDDDDD
jgi:hypothetical protein